IVERLRRAPEWLVVPVGGGSTIAAIHRGFDDLVRLGVISRAPRLVGVVPKTHDTLAEAWRLGIADPVRYFALPADDPPTLLTKRAHGHPPDGLEALAVIRASNGRVIAVGEDEALDGARRIGHSDGLYVEPSSGVVIPAVERLLGEGHARPGDSIVALVCGSGFPGAFAVAARRQS